MITQCHCQESQRDAKSSAVTIVQPGVHGIRVLVEFW